MAYDRAHRLTIEGLRSFLREALFYGRDALVVSPTEDLRVDLQESAGQGIRERHLSQNQDLTWRKTVMAPEKMRRFERIEPARSRGFGQEEIDWLEKGRVSHGTHVLRGGNEG
jgi:hypothetical protein